MIGQRRFGQFCLLVLVGVAAVTTTVPCSAQEQQGRVRPRDVGNLSVAGCGYLRNAFGPFDYRDPAARGQPLRLVESAHFTPRIEGLQQDTSLGSINVMTNLNYVLRAFPNHHRALNSVASWEIQGNKIPVRHLSTAECYFKRATVFAPDDAVVRMLYGNYLTRKGELSGAMEQYEESLRLDPSSAETHYNVGLLFLRQGDLPKARQHADLAYAAGYPLPGLREKIRSEERGSSVTN